MTATAEPLTLTAAPLWERTRAMYARAVAAIGAPMAIAAISLLTRALRRDIIRRLALLEHVVRKLLLVEAAALHHETWQNGKPGQARIVHLGRVAQTAPEGARSSQLLSRAVDLTQPHTWSARFSFSSPRDSHAVPESRAPRIRALWGVTPTPAPHTPLPAPRRTSAPAFLLARRLEALRRALPHARRLAHLLLRLRRRFPEVVTRYLFAPARTGGYDSLDPRLSIDVWSEALCIPEAFADSS